MPGGGTLLTAKYPGLIVQQIPRGLPGGMLLAGIDSHITYKKTDETDEMLDFLKQISDIVCVYVSTIAHAAPFTVMYCLNIN